MSLHNSYIFGAKHLVFVHCNTLEKDAKKMIFSQMYCRFDFPKQKSPFHTFDLYAPFCPKILCYGLKLVKNKKSKTTFTFYISKGEENTCLL